MYRRTTIREFVSFFILFALMFQSGGGIIRSLTLFLLCITLFCYLTYSTNTITLKESLVVFCCYIAVAITISSINSVIQEVSLGSIIAFNFALYFFPFMLLAARTNIITHNGYLNAATAFSLFIVLLNIANLIGIPGAYQFRKAAIAYCNGLWGPKAFGPIIIWIAYFQGTLAIIPAAVDLLFRKEKFKFFIYFFAILSSGSRFGLIVIALAFCLINRKHLLKVVAVAIILFIVLIVSKSELLKFDLYYSEKEIKTIFEKAAKTKAMVIQFNHTWDSNFKIEKMKFLIDTALDMGIEITTRTPIWDYYEINELSNKN